MLMPKKNRRAIYEYLFKEGVMVAEKDFHKPVHPDIEGIPNLQVIKAMQSLKSRDYVKEQFAWRHYYWYLTNEGIQYLRDYLHLPTEIVPATLKRQARQDSRGPRTTPGGRPEGGRSGEDRATYRRAPGAPGTDKKAEVGAGTAELDFRGPGAFGGFGRGRAPPQ
ncbi:small ribosomal subunit protein eS10 [Metopolophium dirhodum]|uniref:small ribosomal subunit protein eS10 n=1 Tax=Metopolophium dirhodum TaxID=44670 RepID=UPI00298F822F|nr:small ribosomal subunit protein eS10 [Metopolophium dirhodum]